MCTCGVLLFSKWVQVLLSVYKIFYTFADITFIETKFYFIQSYLYEKPMLEDKGTDFSVNLSFPQLPPTPVYNIHYHKKILILNRPKKPYMTEDLLMCIREEKSRS